MVVSVSPKTHKDCHSTSQIRTVMHSMRTEKFLRANLNGLEDRRESRDGVLYVDGDGDRAGALGAELDQFGGHSSGLVTSGIICRSGN